ncbi:MAG: ISKra4 family transposase [Kofleriaceae bacterium]|nr:ISKra4 family transposase [Kofleriaceae bacterium]
MATNTAKRIANDSPFCDADAAMDRIKDRLTSPEAMGMTLTEIERMVGSAGHELMRELLQAYVDLRSAREQAVEVTGADGVERTQVRQSTRTVETPHGEISVSRKLYQAPGVDGLAPLDAALGLPDEHYSMELRRLVAVESARASFDEVVELVAKHTGAHVPKRQIEQLTVRAAQDFDAFYDRLLREPEATDDLLILGFDGKGIAMRHADLRPATKRAAETTPRRLDTRLTSGEKKNRKRMAQVATVYTLAPWVRTAADVLHTLRPDDLDAIRPRPKQKRVGASVEHTAQQVVDDAFAEATRRDPEHRRRWVVLVDGQLDQLKRVQRAARKFGAEVTIVLDIVHVLEYLWRAAYAFHAAGTEEAETWVRHRLLALLNGRSAGEIAKRLRGMIERHGLDANAAAPVIKCANYLVKNGRWLHYDRALAGGLPIATGVIEGACRYLVQDRMGRTGARWSLTGAEAILRLRALKTSGDFDDYWQFHLAQEHDRVHRSRYADGEVPNPLPRERPRLTVVK